MLVQRALFLPVVLGKPVNVTALFRRILRAELAQTLFEVGLSVLGFLLVRQKHRVQLPLGAARRRFGVGSHCSPSVSCVRLDCCCLGRVHQSDSRPNVGDWDILFILCLQEEYRNHLVVHNLYHRRLVPLPILQHLDSHASFKLASLRYPSHACRNISDRDVLGIT